MADTIGTVRVELIADPSGIQRGIEQASGALTRISAVGTAVGNVLGNAFTRLAEKFAEFVGALLEGHGDVWDELSDNGQRAVSVISRGFDTMKESIVSVWAQLVDRLAPAFSELVGQLAQVKEGSSTLQLVLDGVAFVFKGVVDLGIRAVAGVRDLIISMEALGSIALRVGQTVAEAARNLFSGGAGEAVNRGLADIAQINADASRRIAEVWKGAHESIARVWSNAPIDAPRLRHVTDEAKRYMRQLAEEAKRVFEQTRTPAERIQLEVDKLSQLFRNGLISAETYGRAIDLVTEKYSGLREVLKSVGQSIASTFTNAILEGKKLGETLQSLLKDIARILLNKVFTDILLGSNTKQGGVGGLLGGLFSNAQGGLYQVGGSGGIDSQVVAFRATPGERVAVGHDAGPGSGGGGQPRVTINNYAQAEVTAERTSDDELLVAIRSVVQEELGSGRTNSVMSGKFGLRPRVRSR